MYATLQNVKQFLPLYASDEADCEACYGESSNPVDMQIGLSKFIAGGA